MPLQIAVSFEPAKNLAYFDIDTSAVDNVKEVMYLLGGVFSRLDNAEREHFLALGDELKEMRVTQSMSEWRHVARRIAHNMKNGHLWDIAPDDCAIEWKDIQGMVHDSPKALLAPIDVVHILGTTHIRNFLRVGDPSYKWSDSKDTQVPVLPGPWTFELTARDDQTNGMGNGHRPARMVAYNADAGHVSIETLLTATKPHASCSVDSATCGFMFDEPMPNSNTKKDAWLDAILDPILDDRQMGPPTSFLPERHAVIAATFLGDGEYPMFVQYNDEGQAVAVALVTDYKDPLFRNNPHMAQDYEDELNERFIPGTP